MAAPAPVVTLALGEPGYPAGLARLGGGAPPCVDLVGDCDLLRRAGILAVFCSELAPGRIVVESFELFAGLGGTVAGGFHSGMERELLHCLLSGGEGIILCPARTVRGTSLPRVWRRAIEGGRMLLVSPFREQSRRPTSALAHQRNRIAAAIASRVLILHATSGGRIERLASEVARWGIPLYCLDHPANEDLRLMGATPWNRARMP